MKKKIFAVTVAMAMATMMLSGCGSSSQSKASEAVPSEAPASEAASTEAAAPDAGEATGETLIVGTNAAFPPFEYVGVAHVALDTVCV